MKKLIALIVSLCMLVGMLPAVAETAAETPATAPADAEKVDMNHLIDQLLNDVNNAVIRVDVEAVKKAGATPESSKGNVFTVLVNVLNNIAETKAKRGEENEDLNKLLAILNDREATKDMDEKELDGMASLLLLGIIADADERAAKQEEEAGTAISIALANGILKEIYDACQANETLAAAVKATDSKLYNMLLANNERFKSYVEKNGALTVANLEENEKNYAEFEAEIKKVEDYLKGIEGNKQGALDLLALLHAAMDDIHEAVDGHTHEDVEKQAAAFTAGAAFGKSLQEIEDAFGRADFEVDQEHTHGPVTFTELEYENASLDGMHADEHYLFVEDKLVAFTICFKDGAVTFDSVVADLSKMYGEAKELDQTVLANGIYAVDDDGKIEGKAVAITVGDMMIVIAEDKDEVEVTYLDLTAAYILANA